MGYLILAGVKVVKCGGVKVVKSCQMWTIKCTYFFDKCLKYDCLRMRIKVLFLDRTRVILSDINAFDSSIFFA